jgi:hypothetical protein
MFSLISEDMVEFTSYLGHLLLWILHPPPETPRSSLGDSKTPNSRKCCRSLGLVLTSGDVFPLPGSFSILIPSFLQFIPLPEDRKEKLEFIRNQIIPSIPVVNSNDRSH